MKSLFTVSGVVFAHICVFLLLVNGCRGNSAGSDDWAKGDTSIYSAGARRSSGPASAVPAASGPAKAVPASVEPAPASAVPAEAKPAESLTIYCPFPDLEIFYVVQKGEYLSTIAVRYGVTAKAIADANGIALDSTLKVGQKLKIPAPKQKTEASEKSAAPADGEIYVVQKGDYLGKIAKKYKVSVAQLKKANGLKSDNIREGQKLVIPSKTEKKADAAAKSEEKAEPKPAPAESAPAGEPAAAPEKSVPAETAAADVPADDNFGMPEGGFRNLDDDAPSSAQPEEAAPAAAGPAAGTPARD